MPIVLLFLALASGGGYYLSRNRGGAVMLWRWEVKGGWSGSFYVWVRPPVDLPGGARVPGQREVNVSVDGGDASFEAARMRALEYIARAEEQEAGIPGAELDVGISAEIVE